MQFKVPQNIDKEDEIVGPLTLVQFSYLAVAFAVDFLAFKSLPVAVSMLIIVPVSIIAFALAFVKVQDRPMTTFLMAMFKFSRDEKVRIWDKQNEISRLQIDKNAVPAVEKEVVPHKEYDQQKVEQIAALVDARGRSPQTTPTETTPAPEKPNMPFTNVDTEVLKK